MKIEIETVKGFQDYLPPESLKRNAVKKVIEKYFKLYGFQPVETPTIEFDELMKPDSAQQEDEAVSDRFKLKDRAGRNLGLRYEFTFQLARIFKQNPNIKLPFRRYQIGSVFRDEPTSAGRFREFTQCDADIIGDSSVQADAEILAVVNDILKELKIESEIEVNNRKLIEAVLESVQITDKKNVMKLLDKMGKIEEDILKAELRRYADSKQIITLFKILEKDFEFFIENSFDGAGELKELKDLCKTYGFNIKINPYMVRGLSYYTGNVFEVKIKNSKNTIAGGGRYDELAGKFIEKEIPAVGLSFGLERITELADIAIEKTRSIVISIEQDEEAIKLTRKLRKSEISSIIAFGNPSKALDYANSNEIPFAVFIGKDEIERKKFKLRDMKSGVEKYLTEKQIIKVLK